MAPQEIFKSVTSLIYVFFFFNLTPFTSNLAYFLTESIRISNQNTDPDLYKIPEYTDPIWIRIHNTGKNPTCRRAAELQQKERKEEGVVNSDTETTLALTEPSSVDTSRDNTYTRFRSMSDRIRYLTAGG